MYILSRKQNILPKYKFPPLADFRCKLPTTFNRAEQWRKLDFYYRVNEQLSEGCDEAFVAYFKVTYDIFVGEQQITMMFNHCSR